MKAILGRAMAGPTVRRPSGTHSTFSLSSFFRRQPLMLRACRPTAGGGGLIPAKPNRAGSATRPPGNLIVDGGGLMPAKPNGVGCAIRLPDSLTADGGGLMPIKLNRGGSATQPVSSLYQPTVSQMCPPTLSVCRRE